MVNVMDFINFKVLSRLAISLKDSDMRDCYSTECAELLLADMGYGCGIYGRGALQGTLLAIERS